MKKTIFSFFVLLGATILSLPVNGFASPEKEKAFTDAYKKAYEAKDEEALKSLLYTKGSDPEIVEFYTMMISGDMESKLTSIELRDLTPEEIARASEAQPSFSGEEVALLVKPTKKLVLKTQTSGAGGTSTGTNETFVAEVDGKYVIPVPGPVKK